MALPVPKVLASLVRSTCDALGKREWPALWTERLALCNDLGMVPRFVGFQVVLYVINGTQ